MSSITLPSLAVRTALSGLTKVINRRSTLPVLAHVKIEKRNGALRWQREAATFLVPLETLKHAAKAASGLDPWVTITADTIAWSTPGGAVSMPWTPFDLKEFPETLSAPFCVAHLDPAARSALLEAETFSSEDETRFLLNGVYIENTLADSPCEPSVVATDGRRLYRRRVPALGCLGANAVLPNKALVVLSSPPLMAHEWKMGLNAKLLRACIKAGPWSLVTKTIEGNYPSYRQVIHADLTDWITAPIPDPQLRLFIAALEQFPPTSKPVIALLFHGDHLRVQCPESNTSVVVPGIRSDAPLMIQFNRNYVRDMLHCGPGTLFLLDADTPCHFSAASGAEHILMPYRGDAPLSVPDPALEALESVWKERRVSTTEPGHDGEPDQTAEGTVLRIHRRGIRLDSALVHFDSEKNPCTIPLAELTLLPPTQSGEVAA